MCLYRTYTIMRINISPEVDALIQLLSSDEKARLFMHLEWIQKHPSQAQADFSRSSEESSIEEFSIPEDDPILTMLGYFDEYGNLHITTGFESDAGSDDEQSCRDQAEAIKNSHIDD